MGPDERENWNIKTALIAIGIAIVAMAIAVTMALTSGCYGLCPCNFN